jgi:hypothetical protein
VNFVIGEIGAIDQSIVFDSAGWPQSICHWNSLWIVALTGLSVIDIRRRKTCENSLFFDRVGGARQCGYRWKRLPFARRAVFTMCNFYRPRAIDCLITEHAGRATPALGRWRNKSKRAGLK